MNYQPFANLATGLLTKFGLRVAVTRDGKAVGSGYGIWTNKDETLDSDQELQTAVNSRRLTVSQLKKDIEVNDLVTVGTAKYNVTRVRTSRPTNETIVQVIEVVPYG